MSAKLSDSLVSPENSLNQIGVRANTNEGVERANTNEGVERNNAN